ncbi:hypothetical protein SCHPADRAFT_947288 [Schizopora paradoxa]|uniref:Uncharacterized protein n=1 Tax=Schizopora paradoxa TaxID=27342 RepID=A0A0H2QZP9_9AGAM|nr:hypothetical protein SCHPADRAFT_947288 [Schizopora paradoxa]
MANPFPHVRLRNGSIIFPVVETKGAPAMSITGKQLFTFFDVVKKDFANEEPILMLCPDVYVTGAGEMNLIDVPITGVDNAMSVKESALKA